MRLCRNEFAHLKVRHKIFGVQVHYDTASLSMDSVSKCIAVIEGLTGRHVVSIGSRVYWGLL